MIRSYSDKTFFFATRNSDEHCSMDATVALICSVSNCCLSLYLHVAGDYEKVLEMENTGPRKSWKSPGIYYGQDTGNPVSKRILHTIRILSYLISYLLKLYCIR